MLKGLLTAVAGLFRKFYNMAFGIEAYNEVGEVVVDHIHETYALVTEYTDSVGTAVGGGRYRYRLPVANDEVMFANIQVGQWTGMSYQINGTIEFFSTQATQTFRKFGRANNVTGGTGFGLEMYDENGDVTFSSVAGQLLDIKGNAVVQGGGQPGSLIANNPIVGQVGIGYFAFGFPGWCRNNDSPGFEGYNVRGILRDTATTYVGQVRNFGTNGGLSIGGALGTMQAITYGIPVFTF